MVPHGIIITVHLGPPWPLAIIAPDQPGRPGEISLRVGSLIVGPDELLDPDDGSQPRLARELVAQALQNRHLSPELLQLLGPWAPSPEAT